MHSVEGATVISPADFTSTDTQNKVTDLLNGCHVDVILSDMVNLQYLTFVESVNWLFSFRLHQLQELGNLIKKAFWI